MMPQVTQTARAALAAAALAATGPLSCSEGTTYSGCDLCTTSAIVRGAVRDTLGVPRQGVLVMISVLGDSCAGPQVAQASVGAAPGPTDSTGRYRYQLRSPAAPFTSCVRAHALLLSNTLLVADTTALGSPLRFRPDYPPGASPDSLTLDLVLRHR